MGCMLVCILIGVSGVTVLLSYHFNNLVNDGHPPLKFCGRALGFSSTREPISRKIVDKQRASLGVETSSGMAEWM